MLIEKLNHIFVVGEIKVLFTNLGDSEPEDHSLCTKDSFSLVESVSITCFLFLEDLIASLLWVHISRPHLAMSWLGEGDSIC